MSRWCFFYERKKPNLMTLGRHQIFFLIWLIALFSHSAGFAEWDPLHLSSGSEFRWKQGFALQNACTPHLRRRKRALTAIRYFF